MSLNLKNPQAHELAARLADLTGETLTTAVIKALEERIEKELCARGKKGVADRILEFADRFAAGMPKTVSSSEHAELLFGEDGLPR